MANLTVTPHEAEQALGFRPLYRQLRDRVMQRIADGRWQAGQALPSEAHIAAEFGVSQGTVRKALDEMAAENILIRRQGKGTFVAEHDEHRMFFQYFRLALDSGGQISPQSKVLSISTGTSTAEEAASLQLADGSEVIRFHRIRSMGGVPCVSEHITLPAQLFPGLTASDIPNNLYGLYASRFAITVTSAKEKLKAIIAVGPDAAALEAPEGTPVLEINRTALAINGVPAELRRSVCMTEHLHYLSDLH